MVKVATTKRAARATTTSAFGTVTRTGHDSSSFYSKKIYSDKGGLSAILKEDDANKGKAPAKKKAVNKATKSKAVKPSKISKPSNEIVIDIPERSEEHTS